MNYDPLIITFKLAFITAVLLLIIGIPIAYAIHYSSSRLKVIFETLVSMPLVLPPTVIGFYLLLVFSPENGIGSWLKNVFDLTLVFSFEGLILASLIYSMPFMVNPLISGFSSLPRQLKEASYMMGKSRITTLFKVLLPNMKPAILTALVLTFAHTVGEFGVVLMIGGSIPGETRVASIAIYDEVEALNYAAANFYSLVLFAITFTILLVVYTYNRGYFKSERL